MKPIGIYKNGNYTVSIFDNGTKIRRTEYDEFVPDFSENCDVKLTDKCSQNCSFCYEGCTKDGSHAIIDFNSNFLNSLHPYTELALNGNDMDHPQLVELLEFLKVKKIIANITVNQNQLNKHFAFIQELQSKALLNGIGVSLINVNQELLDNIKRLKNVVLHTIVGILTKKDIEQLKNKNIKILLLGYKDLRRGTDYKKTHSKDIEINLKYIYDNLENIIKWFNVVSFDNLSIKQLDVKRILSDDEWNEFYMGDDGKYTFYIDLVKNEYSLNSLSNDRFPIKNKSVDEMFKHIRTIK